MFGLLRVSAVVVVLRTYVVLVIKPLRDAPPQLRVELQRLDVLTSLTRRDAVIALRSTDKPPDQPGDIWRQRFLPRLQAIFHGNSAVACKSDTAVLRNWPVANHPSGVSRIPCFMRSAMSSWIN